MIKVYYCHIPNFGDAMNPILLERLLGENVFLLVSTEPISLAWEVY